MANKERLAQGSNHIDSEYFDDPHRPYQQIDGRWLIDQRYMDFSPTFTADYGLAPQVKVVDDNLYAMYNTMAQVLKAGFRTRGYHPSQRFNWDKYAMEQFANEVSKFTAGAILDMSLGIGLNGIMFAEKVSMSTPTIILTGAMNSDELKELNVAYFQRGGASENLIKLLYDTTYHHP